MLAASLFFPSEAKKSSELQNSVLFCPENGWEFWCNSRIEANAKARRASTMSRITA